MVVFLFCIYLYASGADCEMSKLERFQPLLESPLLNLEELRHLSWSGIPVKVRAITWRLLSVNSIKINFHYLCIIFLSYKVKVVFVLCCIKKCIKN